MWLKNELFDYDENENESSEEQHSNKCNPQLEWFQYSVRKHKSIKIVIAEVYILEQTVPLQE